jgi:hypothetical protein
VTDARPAPPCNGKRPVEVFVARLFCGFPQNSKHTPPGLQNRTTAFSFFLAILPLGQDTPVDKLPCVIVLPDHDNDGIADPKVRVEMPGRIKAKAHRIVGQRAKNAAAVFAADHGMSAASDWMPFVRAQKRIRIHFLAFKNANRPLP